ncbi:MarR family transcriptional regulator [Blastococcus sp. TF02-09]|nr:MarR family transcriptional regulator [Blastococcus sp. TF02-9]
MLLASRWFDAQSRELLAQRGWPRLSAAQTLLFAQLLPGGITVAELARRLGTSRQATHEMVRGLVSLGFLELADDPRRRGGRLVHLTPYGHELVADSYTVLRQLETTLPTRHMDALRKALGTLRLSPYEQS